MGQSNILANKSPAADDEPQHSGRTCRWRKAVQRLLIVLLLLAHRPHLAMASFSWPRARIPFEDDPRLVADPDQAVALNNARMDLQVRTCVRLVPRRGEHDYAYFTDLGPHIECWNMFEPFPPKGRILVNAGPSCLEPMRRPHRPRRIFSDCDVEYVNHLYNCPRRRKPSPICPAGRIIMAKPMELRQAASTPAMEEDGDVDGAAAEEDEMGAATSTTPMLSSTAAGEEVVARTATTSAEELAGNGSAESATESTDVSETADATNGAVASSTTEEPPLMPEEVVDEVLVDASSSTTNVPSTEETIISRTTVMPTVEATVPSMEETTLAATTEAAPTTMPLTATTTEAPMPETPPPKPITAEPESTLNPTTTVPLATIAPGKPWTSMLFSSTTTLSEPEATTRGSPESGTVHPHWETEAPLPFRGQPFPLMMTLITTTTTTTIAPPPPDWVRSVEESFRAAIGDEDGRLDNMTTASSSTTTTTSSTTMATTSSSSTAEPAKPPAGGGGSGIGPPMEPMPIRPAEKAKTGGSGSSSEEGGGDEEGGRRRVVVGVIQVPPGQGISIREKTKVTKVVEKTKYIGPCGSACHYAGQLVRLYRSVNQQPAVMDHFYTTERLEQHLMAAQGFVMEPSMGFLGRNQIDPNCTCIRPLYRLYSGFMKDHFLTTAEEEKQIAEGLLGYEHQRTLGYCTREPGCGAYVPLYRFFSAVNRDHFYTSDQQEMHYYKTHTELTYTFEKIECYVWAHSSSAKGCPAVPLLEEQHGDRMPRRWEDGQEGSTDQSDQQQKRSDKK